MVLEEFGVGVTVKPYQKPHPPIALPAISPYSGSMKVAGQRGWIPISSNIIPTYSVASHWQKYLEGCEEANRPADPEIWRVGRDRVRRRERQGRPRPTSTATETCSTTITPTCTGC